MTKRTGPTDVCASSACGTRTGADGQGVVRVAQESRGMERCCAARPRTGSSSAFLTLSPTLFDERGEVRTNDDPRRAPRVRLPHIDAHAATRLVPRTARPHVPFSPNARVRA